MARRVAALAAFAALVAAVPAQAASIHSTAAPVTVEQGGTAETAIAYTASGAMSCSTGFEVAPATVTLDSLYALDATGAPSSSEPAVVEFRSDGIPRGGSGNCTPTWFGAPAPYSQPIRVSADAATPLGEYVVPVGQESESSPDTGSAGKLGMGAVSLTVTVVPATPDPEPLTEPVIEEQLVLGERAVPPLRPELGKTVLLAPVSGRILVRTGGRTIPLTTETELPNGTQVDANRGVVKITVEADTAGTLQSAQVWGGGFKPKQGRGAAPLTVFHLTGPLNASRARKSSLATTSRAIKRRKLWAKGTGKFSSRGRRASAIVRGTEWLVEEIASGTRVRVRTGVVRVRDFTLRRDFLVRAGESYLARERRATARRAPAFTGRAR